jgi:hypothetical protein
MLWVTVAVLLAEYVWFLGRGITMYFAGRG